MLKLILLALLLVGVFSSELCIITASTLYKSADKSFSLNDVEPGTRVHILKNKMDWFYVVTVSELKNETFGWIPSVNVAPCPVAPTAYCNIEVFHLLTQPSEESSLGF